MKKKLIYYIANTANIKELNKKHDKIESNEKLSMDNQANRSELTTAKSINKQQIKKYKRSK